MELFASLSLEELRDLEKRCSWKRYDPGELILDRDSDSRDVYFVVAGQAQVANYSFSGREISLATVRAGGYFGELAAIDHLPRSATVTAAGKCLLAALSPTVFSELLQDHPEIALQVLQRLAKIIRVCDERIMDLSTLRAVQRVYVELLRLATPDAAVSSLWSIYPMPTQADIAGRASTTRETVARVLGDGVGGAASISGILVGESMQIRQTFVPNNAGGFDVFCNGTWGSADFSMGKVLPIFENGMLRMDFQLIPTSSNTNWETV